CSACRQSACSALASAREAWVADLGWGLPPVFIIDREADSVGRCYAAGCRFVVRADDNRKVVHGGHGRLLPRVRQALRDAGVFSPLPGGGGVRGLQGLAGQDGSSSARVVRYARSRLYG
ncbi:MAG: hypothetical protein ACRC33_27440, partial [Gemmataceae bacterium]